jgi:hypothetical protein
MKWNSINSAPKDGTRVLIFVPHDEDHPHETGVLTARFEERWWLVGGQIYFDETLYIPADKPTVWAPVPDGPKP